MLQMYKVFVNDCPIILRDAKKISTIPEANVFDVSRIVLQVEDLFLGKQKSICLYSSNLPRDWQLFQDQFKVQVAGGGKVINENDEILFIKRFGKWDLPKGKMEKNESKASCALREVEEECGVSGLTIDRELKTTYHIFKRKNKTIFKVTHWFLMKTDYKDKLYPQEEEGIVEAVFKNKNEVKLALKNTYANIRLLF